MTLPSNSEVVKLIVESLKLDDLISQVKYKLNDKQTRLEVREYISDRLDEFVDTHGVRVKDLGYNVQVDIDKSTINVDVIKNEHTT